MKNTILALTALATLGLASCASDDPVDINKGDALRFRPAMGTKATETTNANLADIYVTSLLGNTNYFNDVKFSKQGTEFLSDGDYYWPGDDSELTFYSYSPSMDELGADIVINSTTKELQNFTVAEEIADQVDFITATATGKKSLYETTGVPMTFDHRLAQIELQAKSENPHYTFKVIGARIGRAQTTGTFDFGTNKWTLDDWHDTAVYTSSCDPVTLTADPQNIMGPSGDAMLIPQTLVPWSPVNDPDNVAREAYLSVLIQITEKDTGVRIYPFPTDTQKDAQGNPRQYAWASVPLSGTWEAGMKYIYVLDFTNGGGNVDPDDPTPGKPIVSPIKFTVNVTPWVDRNMPINVTQIKK